MVPSLYLSQLDFLKSIYLDADKMSVTEKDRQKRIQIINSMGDTENAMIAIVDLVNDKEWPKDCAELDDILHSINSFRNPTKFLL